MKPRLHRILTFDLSRTVSRGIFKYQSFKHQSRAARIFQALLQELPSLVLAQLFCLSWQDFGTEIGVKRVFFLTMPS